MELNSLPVETKVSQINCLLQHYGMDTVLGTKLTAAIENVQVEIGMTRCPLLYDYNKYGILVTNVWTKTLWVKISAYRIEVSLNFFVKVCRAPMLLHDTLLPLCSSVEDP